MVYYGISTNFGTTILRLKYANFDMACLLYGSELILIIPGMFLSKKKPPFGDRWVASLLLLFIFLTYLDFYLFSSPNIKPGLHNNMEEPIKHDNNNSESSI